MLTLSKTQWWLRMHQCIAFWHGFGISNALQIPKDKTYIVRTDKNGNYRDNGTIEYIAIKPEFMRERLKEYIKWLKQYKESWDTDTYEDSACTNREEFIAEHKNTPAFLDILEMIELLQD